MTRAHKGFNSFTAAERARLRDACVELSRKGYSMKTIAAAADVSESTVSNQLRAAGEVVGRRYREPDIKPAPVAWREDDMHRTDPPPAYKVSTTLSLLNSMLRELQANNAENRFANDVHDAEADADRAWMERAGQTIQGVQEYLDRLRLVLWNPGARTEGMTNPQRRDDVASIHHLRR